MIFHDYQTNRKKRINWLCSLNGYSIQFLELPTVLE
jgi:hypothetical protein